MDFSAIFYQFFVINTLRAKKMPNNILENNEYNILFV